LTVGFRVVSAGVKKLHVEPRINTDDNSLQCFELCAWDAYTMGRSQCTIGSMVVPSSYTADVFSTCVCCSWNMTLTEWCTIAGIRDFPYDE
jgi:hypothetical protein